MRNMGLLNCRLQKTAGCLLLFGLSLSEAVAQVGPPPVITVQPLSQSVPIDNSVTFTVVAVSGTTMTYRWHHDGRRITGARQSTYTISKVKPADEGLYSVQVINASGSVMSSNATLTVLVPPRITTEPQSQTVTVGHPALFSVVASGTEPLSYQWSLNGTALVGATNSALTLNTVQPADAGSYTVGVTNFAGSVTSAVATLIVNAPPLITTEPQSQTVTVGQDASFSVVAGGTAPLSYQWSLNGTALSGGASSVLTLTNVQTTDAGSYTVVVTNPVGSATSAVATLTVTNPPCTTPPRFGSAGMTANGFTFQLSVSIGCDYVILASTNLKDWTPISSNVALTETLEFTDSTATNLSVRFYRARVQ